MGIVDHVHLLSGLWIERTDLSVAPTRDDAFSITHEGYGVALAVGVVDSEELCAVFGVPDTDIV